MSRWLRVGLGCCTAVACTAALAVGAGAAAIRQLRRARVSGCYFTSLKVERVSCRTGRKVTLAHHRCRTESGRAGRCGRRVLRYRCSEQRNSIPTEINARVTCRRGGAKVVYTYQQNT